MPGTDISEKNPLHVSEVDDNLKELSPHGSFELPVETYTGDCEIFHALYDHWHSVRWRSCILRKAAVLPD